MSYRQGMDMFSDEWRRERLSALADKVGGKAPLGRLLGYKDGAFVRQMIAGERPITDKTIKTVHERPGLAGWFSHPSTTSVTSIPQVGDAEASSSNVLLVGLNKSVPRLAWNEIQGFIQGMFKPPADRYEIVSARNVTERCFLLEVSGDSMDGPVQGVPSGSVLVCDPDRPPEHDRLVIAMHPRTGEPVFRRLMIDGGVWFLKANNPAYPLIEIDGPAAIVARVFKVTIERDV